MATERTRVLRKEPTQNAVEMLVAQANPPNAAPATATTGAETPQPILTPVPVAAEPADEAKKNRKQQVNYRLDPALPERLKHASIEFSYRQGRQYSQNAIVELAIEAWLDANGPWQR